MKKIFYTLVLFVMVLSGVSAQAARFGTGERYEINEGETVNDDLYVASGNSVISGTINGDLFVLSGNVRVDGTVNGGLIAAGGQIDLNGSVGGSVRAAGGNIYIGGKVGKDLIVTGGSVDLASGAAVNGDTLISGGQINIAGTTGKVSANAGNIRVASTAKINGNLEFASEKAEIDSEADIQGETIRREIKRDNVIKDRNYQKPNLFWVFVSFVSTVILALLLVYLFKESITSLSQNWRTRFWINLLWGLVYLVITPVIILLLIVTILGIPLGFILALLFALSIFVGKISGVIVFGSWLYSLLRKDQPLNMGWQAIVLGALVLTVLKFIPFVGALVSVVVFVSVLGALAEKINNIFKEKRKKTLTNG